MTGFAASFEGAQQTEAKAIRVQILEEEEKQIEDARKKRDMAEANRHKETAVAKLFEQLRHFEQLVKNGELKFKRKKKSNAQLKDLYKRCYAAYTRPRR